MQKTRQWAGWAAFGVVLSAGWMACGSSAQNQPNSKVNSAQARIEQKDAALTDSAQDQDTAGVTQDSELKAAMGSVDQKEAMNPRDDKAGPDEVKEKDEMGRRKEESNPLKLPDIAEFLLSNKAGKALFVKIAWGNFPRNNALKGSAVDYSGTLSITGTDGVLKRVRGWHFDSKDALIPRTDKASLGFSSHVSVASDGLQLLVLSPDSKGTLNICLGGESCAQFKKSYDLSALTDHIAEALPSQTAAQQIKIAINPVAYAPSGIGCEAKTFEGRVVSEATTNGKTAARVVGRLLDQQGNVIATSVGFLGERKGGAHVVFMKIYNDTTHTFIGLLRGLYQPETNTWAGMLFGPGRLKSIGSAQGQFILNSEEPAASIFEGTFMDGAQCAGAIVNTVQSLSAHIKD